MKIVLLGTGTPAPSRKRQSSGYLVEIGTDKIIMDHGPGAHHRLIESGRSATDVTHAFFSHLHYDHCMDYPRLVLQRWDMGAGKIPELKVYGPPPLKRMTAQLFNDDGVFGPDIVSRTTHQASLDIFQARGGKLPRNRPAPEVREVLPGEVINDNRWRITVGIASHFQPYLECYGYRLDSSEGSFCYSGDSGGIPDSMIELAKDVDILIHMLHFNSGAEPSAEYRRACGNHKDVAEIAQRANVGTLVLSHMTKIIDQPGVREQILAEMATIYGGRIIWGEDLMEIPIQPVKADMID